MSELLSGYVLIQSLFQCFLPPFPCSPLPTKTSPSHSSWAVRSEERSGGGWNRPDPTVRRHYRHNCFCPVFLKEGENVGLHDFFLLLNNCDTKNPHIWCFEATSLCLSTDMRPQRSPHSEVSMLAVHITLSRWEAQAIECLLL